MHLCNDGIISRLHPCDITLDLFLLDSEAALETWVISNGFLIQDIDKFVSLFLVYARILVTLATEVFKKLYIIRDDKFIYIL